MPKNRNSKPSVNENWKVVVLAIAGAATFWLFNALNKNYDTRVKYPLEFEFARDSVVVVSPLVDEVYIDVNGGGWNLLRNTFWLNSSSIKIELENPTNIKYYTQASLLPIISGQLSGMKLNYVVTDTIFVNIEEKITRKVKVLVDSIQIPLDDDHRLVSEIKLSIDSITISGPRSLMTESNNYVWARFENEDIDSDFNTDVPIELPGNGLVSANTDEVRIEFEVDKFVEHNLKIDLEMLNFPASRKEYLADSSVILNFTIGEDRISDLNLSDFGITADFFMKDKADSTISPVLTFYPDHIADINIVPEKLKVKFLQ